MSLDKFSIVDTTLREGEQSFKVSLTHESKIKLIHALNDFGMDYIELASPMVSEKSFLLCKEISRQGFKSKILTHVRCCLEDVKRALETEVSGINLFFGTSSYLKQYSHGKEINEIIDIALQVVDYIKGQSPDTEVRFSCEDTFRSTEDDIFRVFLALEIQGKIDRFGLADTVGIALPKDIEEIIGELREYTHRDIEFHGHNDTGCAIINSYTALKAGATHIDTTILGVGERNGITPLCGLIAILYREHNEILNKKYHLKSLKKLSDLFSQLSGVSIPLNHYIVGESSFCHKGGIHTNAILNNPSSYECINPEDFGLVRKIMVTHEMVGWHAVQHRAEELGLMIDTFRVKELTKQIKELASSRKISLDEVDKILREGV